MNKQQLAAKIWASANEMRSKIEANEYKDYILGFIFYKFLSDKEMQYLIKDGWTKEDIVANLNENERDVVKNVQDNLGYFIAYEDLFGTWLDKGQDFSIDDVRTGLSAFSMLITRKKVFENIFKTLETGLSKLGEGTGAQTKAVRELIKLIKDIPTDGKQDYDVLGFIYEYLISNFAANAGKKAGEFYTPHEVSELMSEIVAYTQREKQTIDIYDPTSGSGSLLINIGKAVSKHITDKDKIKYYAQELKENTYNLTRMNLVMRGVKATNIIVRNGDTLEDDWPYFDECDPNRTYSPLYVDAVVSNPPYSQKWDVENKDTEPRYKDYGVAPKTKADYAFLLHDLFHVKPDGIMTIVLPHGVLFRGGEEEKIRTNLIEKNNIDAIIGLPANIFFGTGIPTIIMVLKQHRPNTDVLIVDASKGFVKQGKNNKLQASNIKRIVDAYVVREDIPKFAKVVARDTIRENGYNLNIPRYVDSSEDAENWDIYATMFGGVPNSEIDDLKKFWEQFKGLKAELFQSDDTPYSKLKVEDINEAIKSNSELKSFVELFSSKFQTFPSFLNAELIEKMQTLSIPALKNTLANDIFARVDFTPLIDKYKAYQILDDQYSQIAIDLEIIQTEGFESVKVVDPNMVVKKKDNKDIEVQDGYVGRILPFDLVQEVYFKAELDSISAKENRLAEITSAYDEILESLSEEDKESDCINEDGTAFVGAEVVKSAKMCKKSIDIIEEGSFEDKIMQVDKLIAEEKEIKKQVKQEKSDLHTKTKTKIESLTDAEAVELLKKKWIEPINNSLIAMPNGVIAELTTKVTTLAEKYKTTFMQVEDEIAKAEQDLSVLLEDLTGNDYDMQGIAELKKLLEGGNND